MNNALNISALPSSSILFLNYFEKDFQAFVAFFLFEWDPLKLHHITYSACRAAI